MNALVVFFSKYGNTKVIAEAIADGLHSVTSIRLVELIQLAPSDFDGIDLLVMGCPTHKMNLPQDVRPILEGLPKKILKGIPVAAFDTSYRMSDRDSPEWLAKHTAARKLAKRLRKLGGKLIVAPESFHVKDREGPLYEGEVERAKSWTVSILRSLEAKRKG
ncbi:MAG TPA: flavodoxin family protein [Anaerolineae bacterium]|nr:flavodoxin family protein [Anaerolineae bacterium]